MGGKVNLIDILSWVVVGLMVICVAGIGIASVTYSYYEEIIARRERRERAKVRRTEAENRATGFRDSSAGDDRGWLYSEPSGE
jgi:hypothetical protein